MGCPYGVNRRKNFRRRGKTASTKMDEQEELAALQELQHRIEKARAVMESDPHHDLNFGQVMSVISMFGQRLEDEDMLSNWDYYLDISEEQREAELPGRERRQWNALLCAEKIVGFWSYAVIEEYLPVIREYLFDDERFEDYKSYLSNIDLQAIIESTKLGVLLREPFKSPNYRFIGDELTNILRKEREVSKPVYQATNAYGAIETILGVAIRDELNCFDATKIYQDHWCGDWYHIPSVIWASYTFAGLPEKYYSPFDDPQARREFWTW